MLTYMDVVTGFFENGKTSFCKKLIAEGSLSDYKKIVLVVCEEGFEEYEESIFQEQVTGIFLTEETELNDEFLSGVMEAYDPDYILVEFNGTWDINRFLGIATPYALALRHVIAIVSQETFSSQVTNMPDLVCAQIVNSDLVLVNRGSDVEKEKDDESFQIIKKQIHDSNPRIQVLREVKFWGSDRNKAMFLPKDRKDQNFNALICVLLMGVGCLIPLLLIDSLYERVQSVVTVFISILLEALPFILVGSLVSTLIQMFVRAEWVKKGVAKKKWWSFIVASVGGLFLPVCDCGTVPIVTGLLRKGTPLPQTMTFWMASSAVNPVVFLSMLYAFPGQPKYAFMRMGVGVLSAISVGVVLSVTGVKTEQVLRTDGMRSGACRVRETFTWSGIPGRMEAVLRGASMEFFRVGKYVILGALLASVMQSAIPGVIRDQVVGSVSLQFGIMLLASVVMSTCSTSNAFIGRSFLTSFSIYPIMSFITLGPVLDIKNMIMLSGTMKKRFLLTMGAVWSIAVIGCYILILVWR